MVYHHGSGFRDSAGGRRSRLAYGEREAKASLAGKVAKRLPKHGRLGKVRRRLNPARRLRDSLRAETRELSEGILAEMKRDDEFWRRFVPQ